MYTILHLIKRSHLMQAGKAASKQAAGGHAGRQASKLQAGMQAGEPASKLHAGMHAGEPASKLQAGIHVTTHTPYTYSMFSFVYLCVHIFLLVCVYAYLCILVCMIMYAYTCAYVWCTYTYICVSCRPRTQEGPSCSLAFCLDVWWTVRFFGHAPEVWRKPSVALDVLWSYGKRFLSWFWFPVSRFLLGYFTSNV